MYQWQNARQLQRRAGSADFIEPAEAVSMETTASFFTEKEKY